MTGIFSKKGVSLERLQTLEKVVRAGSIALAAKGDPVAQSQISRQIGELEKVLGLEGDGGFRKFLAECERKHGVSLQIGAECTTYPQAVELAEAANWAVFVPELGWKRRQDWMKRQQRLPGLDGYRHTLQLGWNEQIIQRRPEVAKLVEALGGRRK